MDPITEQRDKLAEIRTKCSKSLDEARSRGDMKLTAEEQVKYDAWTAEADEVRQVIRNLESEERMRLEGELDEERRNRAVIAPPNASMSDAETRAKKNDDEMRAYTAFLRNEDHGRGDEYRALRIDQDTAGGYLQAPIQMQSGILKAMDDSVVMRQLASVESNMTADSLDVVTLDNDPADPAWTSELDPGSEDSTMSFGMRELTPHELSSYIKVSNKALRRRSDLAGFVQSRLAYKFGIKEENGFINGTGDGEPLGIMTASDFGISTGQDVSTGNAATYPTLQGLKRAKYALPSGYWGNANWLMHQDCLLLIDLLEDSQGRPLLQPDLTSATGYRLFGVPIQISNQMPSTFTASLYVAMIADFSYYQIADAETLRIMIEEHLYALTKQTAFFAELDCDGMPTLEEAFVRVKLGS